MVYPIFSRDFHLKNESIETESIENALNVLIKEEILQINNMNEISSPDLKDEKFNNYLALTNLSEPAGFQDGEKTILKKDCFLSGRLPQKIDTGIIEISL